MVSVGHTVLIPSILSRFYAYRWCNHFCTVCRDAQIGRLYTHPSHVTRGLVTGLYNLYLPRHHLADQGGAVFGKEVNQFLCAGLLGVDAVGFGLDVIDNRLLF